ncbi:MAG: DUF4215 domain-containing protein, partial [Pseudomonadales bacterium]|nr:DUF4215 domain-containing protein [Pseudomonadales bacterium]
VAGADKCQGKVTKSYLKIVDTKLKIFNGCKNSKLKSDAIMSAADLETCFDDITADTKSKVAKTLIKLADALNSSCGGVDLNAAFAGSCAGGVTATCIDERVECRVCLMLNAMDNLNEDCDLFDDGNANGTCPPPGPTTTTTSTTTTSTSTTTLPVCGDGIVQPSEDCDDSNTEDGDCCSMSCEYESNGSLCDDGDVCTDDTCDGAGTCNGTNNSAPCDDGNFCNGADTCSGGTCSSHAGDPCAGPDGDGDCAESCDEGSDTCTAADPDASACDDGDFCNGTETCSSGVCTNSTGDPCAGPDGDNNCAESCDEGADACTADDPNGSACDDGLFCTATDT